MFERFTDRARRVVVLAQEEARQLDHGYIGTEHLLLGLLLEDEGMAARALDGLGVSRPAARDQVLKMVGRGQGAHVGHIPFTPRAKKALELSLREALQLGHNHIGTEHILLGLIREGEGVAAQVLTELGVDLDRARAKVAQLVPAGTTVTMERGGAMRMAVSGMAGIIRRLDAIAERLDAIERHLGLAKTGPARAAEAAGGAEAAGAGEAASVGEAAAAGGPAGEAGGGAGAPPGGQTGTGD
jgi:ATP-dependent Clp protease ATP-binding subunit ClpA